MNKPPGSVVRHLALFEQQRQYLFAIAYRMLGTYHEAEDVLQDVFLQWQNLDLADIVSPAAMLKTLTVRRSTDLLRKASRQREEYIGPWLPGPLLTSHESETVCSRNTPEYHKELADSLSLGFMMLLEKLNPAERAVYILRSGFDLSYTEIARDLQLSEANCRQLFSRARKRLHLNPDGAETESQTENHQILLQKFVHAIEVGDIGSFAKELAEEVVLYSDGGGKAIAALRPIYGKDKVARLIDGLAKKWQTIGPQFKMASINGQAGLLWLAGDSLQTVVTIDTGKNGIHQIFLMRNPDKIAHLTPTRME